MENRIDKNMAGATFACVKIFRRTMALTMAALWLPVSMHCSLEAVPGFDLFDWCCDTAASQAEKDDCSKDSCAEIEAGLYRVEDNPALTPNLAFVLMCVSWAETPQLAETITPAFFPTGSSPPEFSRIWQFTHRAALPVRAPSFVS